jgi:hypothetical protein
MDKLLTIIKTDSTNVILIVSVVWKLFPAFNGLTTVDHRDGLFGFESR